MADLTPKQRAHLKGLAHHLNPVVHIGKDGLSDNLRRQLDDALDAHELVKVKLLDSAPFDRDEAGEKLPEAAGAFLVQNIGRVFVLYRPHPEQPRIELPWPAPPEDGEGEEGIAPQERTESLLGSVRERGARTLTPPPRPTNLPERPVEKRQPKKDRNADRGTARAGKKKKAARGKGSSGRRGGKRPR